MLRINVFVMMMVNQKVNVLFVVLNGMSIRYGILNMGAMIIRRRKIIN